MAEHFFSKLFFLRKEQQYQEGEVQRGLAARKNQPGDELLQKDKQRMEAQETQERHSLFEALLYVNVASKEENQQLQETSTEASEECSKKRRTKFQYRQRFHPESIPSDSSPRKPVVMGIPPERSTPSQHEKKDRYPYPHIATASSFD